VPRQAESQYGTTKSSRNSQDRQPASEIFMTDNGHYVKYAYGHPYQEKKEFFHFSAPPFLLL